MRLMFVSGSIAVLTVSATFAARISAHTPAPGAPTAQTAPAIDSLAAAPRLKGDGKAGQVHFEKICSGCHRVGDIGRDVGPDLTTLASRFKRGDVLEAIRTPSKTISDQYEVTVFELNDGTIVSGIVSFENATRVLVRTSDAPDKPTTIPVANIKERSKATTSLMPEGLVKDLNEQQLEDLLAFLLTAR
jgi:putative heme-binding domain-containing protein